MLGFVQLGRRKPFVNSICSTSYVSSIDDMLHYVIVDEILYNGKFFYCHQLPIGYFIVVNVKKKLFTWWDVGQVDGWARNYATEVTQS